MTTSVGLTFSVDNARRRNRRAAAASRRAETSTSRTCRHEPLDRTLIWNQRHLLHALREYERFYNLHRPHQGIANVRPLKPLPKPITDPDQLTRLSIHRRDRLGGVLREYEHAA